MKNGSKLGVSSFKMSKNWLSVPKCIFILVSENFISRPFKESQTLKMQGKSLCLWTKAFRVPKYLMSKWRSLDPESLFQLYEKWNCNKKLILLPFFVFIVSPQKQGLVLADLSISLLATKDVD